MTAARKLDHRLIDPFSGERPQEFCSCRKTRKIPAFQALRPVARTLRPALTPHPKKSPRS